VELSDKPSIASKTKKVIAGRRIVIPPLNDAGLLAQSNCGQLPYQKTSTIFSPAVIGILLMHKFSKDDSVTMLLVLAVIMTLGKYILIKWEFFLCSCLEVITQIRVYVFLVDDNTTMSYGLF